MTILITLNQNWEVYFCFHLFYCVFLGGDFFPIYFYSLEANYSIVVVFAIH